MKNLFLIQIKIFEDNETAIELANNICQFNMDDKTKMTECYSGASATSYECGYVWRNGYPSGAYKKVKASVVGCAADYDRLGRTLYTYNDVNSVFSMFAGGFAIGNPSLQPAHRSDSGSDDGTIRV